jgi:acyl-CoA reductase-like NAD-dependent aldehyde dehydrogenase
MDTYKMWIGGKYVEAETGKTFGVINPATGEEIARVPLGGQADVEKAVAAATRAFPEWSGKSQPERSAIVNRIGALIREHTEELAMLDCLDHGTPITMARHMITAGAAGNFEFNAQAARSLMADVIPIRPDALHFFHREPVGVCALIIPWNVPLPLIGSKLGSALSVGNTCVVKPPSIDSLAALKLAEILDKAGLPEGAVNIITGPGDIVGHALAVHPGVDLISFTGSSETGKQIMARASQTVKRLTLELGGKNPFIVLEDADIDAAAQKAVTSSLLNSGQICASPGRYYIIERHHDEFVSKFIEGAKNFKVGNPLDEKTNMGPLVSAEHRDKVEYYIRSGIEEGAKLVLGGKRPTEPPFDKGYYVMPTIFTNVTQNIKIAREEIFGPVACVLKYKSEDEVIELANDNTFGLCASVWTRDILKAISFAKKLRAGTIYINDHLTIGPEMPWGGFRESGIGKENSVVGLEEYTQLKLIAMELTK